MDSEAKTIDEDAQKQEVVQHTAWLAAAIRERGRIGRKRLYRMRPERLTLLDFEAAITKLRNEGKITGTNILIWAGD